MKKIVFAFCIVCGVCSVYAKNQLPEDVLKQLNSYNVAWNTLSVSGSMESMPLGNGDITANVWIEKEGDLLLYIGKSDTWSEATRLLKVGRIRIHLSPNPFTDNAGFSQTLNLYGGEINVSAGGKGNETRLKIWIDANQPVIHIETESKKDISVSCTTELLRPHDYTLPSPNDPLASSFRGLLGSPVKPAEKADVLVTKPDRIQWYHRNESSFYPAILTKQNVPELVGKYSDPYIHRTFGAAVLGSNVQPANDSTLVSTKAEKKFNLSVYAYTAQTETVDEWNDQLNNLVKQCQANNIEILRKNHYAWWDEFWNRSWIFLSGDEDAHKITQAYLLQRFMMACQSRGAYPAKFNGGNFTFDYKGLNGDYRNWGPGYWHQNNRLYYMPLTASGDFDLLKPWFDMYKNMLGIQTDITRKYYGHGGAFFPETLNFFGLYIQDDWGWNNIDGKASDTRWIRYHYSGALEVLTLMLEYYDYTKDEAFAKEYVVPFAEQVIRFFDQHWPRISGTIRFVPANAIEQFWDCVNPVDYNAGLRYTIAKLNQSLSGVISKELLNEWNDCLKSLPPLPLSPDKQKMLPAEEYGIGRNFENPECYVIFPFKLYGVGLPDIDLAIRTYNDRIWKQSNCWSQCPIQAALLGLTDEACKGIIKNITSLDPDVRFPAFWKPGSDYIPDFDNGGVFTLALQNMLLQNVDRKIYLLPAFPETWSVDFKLKAFDNTTMRVKSHGKTIDRTEIYPEYRKKDVIL
ncbi:hypothetical protein AGMMS50262_07660 [Bacteroidia bacterium]|nr:hypothetical protein AGMMS50262_07660 [Bacteroidia bacterium]